jgi:hypothetical protein
LTGRESGTAPGQIGSWVCPGDGCQAIVCAPRLPNANTVQKAEIESFITILTAKYNQSPLQTRDRKSATHSASGRQKRKKEQFCSDYSNQKVPFLRKSNAVAIFTDSAR